MECKYCGSEEFLKIRTEEERVELDDNGEVTCILDENILEVSTICAECRAHILPPTGRQNK